MSFIDWFLNEPDGKLFARVDEAFIKANISDPKIIEKVGDVSNGLKLLFSSRVELSRSDEKKARTLYGLLHRKFLLTDEGRRQMIQKFQAEEFPKCCRYFCCSRCFPMGLTEELGKDTVKMFCPNCTDAFECKTVDHIDGAFFGKEWIHLLMNSGELELPDELPFAYEPKVYGFRVSLQRKPGVA